MSDGNGGSSHSRREKFRTGVDPTSSSVKLIVSTEGYAMQTDLRIEEWPEFLQGVLDKVETAEHQPYREFRTDSEHVMRRRRTSVPVPLFKTTAMVSESQWRELQRMTAESLTKPMRRCLYSFPHPSGEGTAYGLLIDASLRSQSYHWRQGSAKALASYHVEVLFEDRTRQVLLLRKQAGEE